MMLRNIIIGATALAAAACGEIAEHNAGKLHTLADLTGSKSLLPQGFTARGQPLALLSPPYSTDSASQAADVDGLTVFPSYIQALPGAYVVTELWEEFSRVWAQPVYVPALSVDPVGGPQALAGAKPIFSVAPGSRFYSPFWQTWYVIVPANTRPDRLTSVADVLNSKFPLVQGPNVYATLGVPEIGPAHAANKAPQRPLTKDDLVARLPQQGWIDGKAVWYLDFGRDRFRIDDKTKLVQETVLYEFVVRDPAGNVVPLGLPRVGGTGAFRGPRAVDAPNFIPQFGAFSHEFQVVLQQRAGDPVPAVFIPKAMTALRAKYAGLLGDALVPTPGPVAEGTPDKDQFILKVALDGTCFTAGDFPNGCTWLDTQANVENNLPGASFIDTRRWSATAIVFFDGIAL